jgi:pimeloyl-ACP methyl ester carboxylesterase
MVRAMMIMLTVLLACFFSFIGVLLVNSPGKPKPFLDEDGSRLPNAVSEKIHVDINGLQQGMFIKSRDAGNPVLLYVHGGLPDYFLTQTYPTGLEDYFTVVWWEQRGSGISYDARIAPEAMTLEHMVSDTIEVTHYLMRRFSKEKIYLMGHSGGTFVGIQAAALAPELYHAYIGVAQMSNQLESERLAYQYMLKEFKDRGDDRMVKRLEAAPVTTQEGTPDGYRAIRDQAMHSLGIGTTREMKSIVTGIFLPSLFFREYTFMEKVDLWRGKSGSGISILWKDIIATDLSSRVPALELPAYFLEGAYDYTCSYSEAKAYFQKLEAPVKGFYTFDRSAHSPLFEEPEKTLRILRLDVLHGLNALADAL